MKSQSIYRTCLVGEVDTSYLNKSITLSGWVATKRDHGKLVFIDLRDSSGVIQLVSDVEDEVFSSVSELKLESVITVSGTVKIREDETINEKIKNGDIEIQIVSLKVLSVSEPLPFQISDDSNYPEDIRLKYRFLDLRRSCIKNNIVLRSEVIWEIRCFMKEHGFMEVQTPILTASSPEGARDYVVPSRLHKGKFYALPQAPQIFKQLLMVSGFHRYFQIAPCFRDEDSRADRSPGEFYQLDAEMSFVEQEDVFLIFEQLLIHIFSKFSDKVVDDTFYRISYKESMDKYGTDKPDLRNPITISDVTEIFRDSGFSVFANGIKNGCIVKAIPALGASSKPRAFFDKKIDYAIKELKAKGLGYITFDVEGNAKGPIVKFLTQDEIDRLKEITKISNEDAVFFTCERPDLAIEISGNVRKVLGEELNLIDDNKFMFCWITDFPYFFYDQFNKKIDFFHNPFSMPQGGMEALLNDDPMDILAYQYDIVCNGVELSSGAVRNHKLDILYKAFEIAGSSKEEVDSLFPSLTVAFKYGPPPHAGIAPGIDRMLMLLADEMNIREVICFPMTQKGEDLLMNAPSSISQRHLSELGIRRNERKS